MNPGGEPERDDTGLPPVDIEIPDDARELDRDVQSYHRELRAQRREQRRLRFRGSLTKDGIILPLLACCLILALITGTLLTVFTATSDPNLLSTGTERPPTTSHTPSGGATSPASSSAPAAGITSPAVPEPAALPGVLPSTTIAVGGQAPAPVRGLAQAALVLIPSHCNCAAAVAWLIHVVTGAHARPYLVYTAASQADVDKLYGSLSASNRAQVVLALEPDNALRNSIPESLQESGLAAILIGPQKAVTYATGLGTRDDPTTLIKALTH